MQTDAGRSALVLSLALQDGHFRNLPVLQTAERSQKPVSFGQVAERTIGQNTTTAQDRDPEEGREARGRVEETL